MLAIGFAGYPLYARTVRSSVLTLRDQDFVSAAQAIGVPSYRIILRHLFPNTLTPIIVIVSLDIGNKIILAAGLSFLGLGAQPPTADWGTMLSAGRQFVSTAPHVATLPGLAIFIVVISFNLIGDGLRDLFDPRSGLLWGEKGAEPLIRSRGLCRICDAIRMRVDAPVANH